MDAEIIEITRSEAEAFVSVLQRCLRRPSAQFFRIKVRKESSIKKHPYTYETIIDAICEASGISKENLKGTRGKRQYSDVRSATSAIIHELWPELSLREIGMFTNRTNHATVMNHLRSVSDIQEVQILYQEIKFKLGI